jgi:hypothetical protein
MKPILSLQNFIDSTPSTTGASGPCAKTQVKATILTDSGLRFTGENSCLTAQARCPRNPGEGYGKCKTVCNQPGHAEEIALEKAGFHARGADVYLEGIGHYCKECQEKLFAGGIRSLRMGAPPGDRDYEGILQRN